MLSLLPPPGEGGVAADKRVCREIQYANKFYDTSSFSKIKNLNWFSLVSRFDFLPSKPRRLMFCRQSGGDTWLSLSLHQGRVTGDQPSRRAPWLFQ